MKKQRGQKGKAAKLSNRYYGPFRISDLINDVTCRLELPAHWNIHNAFHVSLLRPYLGSPPEAPVQEDPPEVEDEEEMLQPRQIIRNRERKLKSGTLTRKYLVKFKNYSPLNAQWMTEAELQAYPDVLNSYLEALQLRTTV